MNIGITESYRSARKWLGASLTIVIGTRFLDFSLVDQRLKIGDLELNVGPWERWPDILVFACLIAAYRYVLEWLLQPTEVRTNPVARRDHLFVLCGAWMLLAAVLFSMRSGDIEMIVAAEAKISGLFFLTGVVAWLVRCHPEAVARMISKDPMCPISSSELSRRAGQMLVMAAIGTAIPLGLVFVLGKTSFIAWCSTMLLTVAVLGGFPLACATAIIGGRVVHDVPNAKVSD